MSRSLRYQNSIICDHLASQYVAGAMSSRVQARTQALIRTTPELDRAVARYADDFSTIHQYLPEPKINAKQYGNMWQRIEKEISRNAASTPHSTRAPQNASNQTGFWEGLFAWKLTTGISAFTSIALAFMLWFAVPESTAPISTIANTVTGPSYLANMISSSDPEKEIQFIISAYGASENTPSRLFVQWSEDFVANKIPEMHVWAEDKETGQVSYIGANPAAGENWDMTKPLWKKVASSSRLFVTADKQQPTTDNILFSGRCLQLKRWTAKKA